MSRKPLATRPWWQQLLLLLLVLGAVLLIERQVQVFMGKRALAASDLPSTSYADAMLASQTSGKPVLANFSAIWCGACRRLVRNVLADPQVRARILKNYHYTRLEYESARSTKDSGKPRSDRDWFEHFGISGFPTLLIIDGASVRALPLTYSAQSFLELI